MTKQVNVDDDVTQHSDDVHMVDESTDEALESISTHSQSLPPPPPAPRLVPCINHR